MIFDGDCRFCRRWIRRWQILTGDSVEYAPSQEAAPRFPQISAEAFQRSVQFIDSDGKIYSGAEGVFRCLSKAKGKSWPLWVYRYVPGAAGLFEGAYRLVAQNRTVFSWLTRFFWGTVTEPPTYGISASIFVRALGLIYAVAFFSLYGQILGLIGSNGILPAAEFLAEIRQQTVDIPFHLLPTLFWWNDTDAFIKLVCLAGGISSLFVAAGLLQGPLLALCWFLYLSILGVGREFLSFQWDILLLEAGFLSVFFAPWTFFCKPSRAIEPPALARWMLWLLLFKLMFSSGVVKLSSGDETWKNLTALNVHYETQPLPHAVSWYAHQLPGGFQKFSTFAMFGVELIIPFLIFFPRRIRNFASLSMIALQVLILFTGNYCFFNYLAIALCILLLDDAFFPYPRAFFTSPEAASRWKARIFVPFAAILLFLTPLQLAQAFRWNYPWPAPVTSLYRTVNPFHIINGYGLFAVMTTSRPEIIVEGSRDGQEWQAYGFKYKPGDLQRRPKLAAPHQPRLDWQMWFAALNPYQYNTWFIHFCVRLLQDKEDVLDLLETNPFPDGAPKYIRAVVYDYRFTDYNGRKKDGSWWKREIRGLYCPVLSLREKNG